MWEDKLSRADLELLADRIWGEIVTRSRAPEKELTRVRGVLDILARREEPRLLPKQGAQGRWFMPDLPATPWMDRAAFEPLATKIEQLYPDLRAEILAAEEKTFRPYGHPTQASFDDDQDDVRPDWSPSGWDEVRLWEDFRPTLNVLQMPASARALRAIVETNGPLVNHVAFLAMKPGTQIPVHHDRTNWYVSIHLGVVVPPAGCVLRVADEERSWEEGKCLFFDNSFAHEAWNKADARRIIFAVYLAHPQLTPAERSALRVLQTRYHSLASLSYEATIAWAHSR